SEARGWWDVVAGTIVPPVIEGAQSLLQAALATLPPEPWDRLVFATWLAALEAATGRDADALVPLLRLALTGEETGPDLGALLPLMGRARAALRLQVAAS
ncbi:MAG: glutamate--tRNA ligase, partial [Rhodospirillales bacterium]|nr:glutamate--tRNA ligase [Rhodospirillales bacterium]